MTEVPVGAPTHSELMKEWLRREDDVLARMIQRAVAEVASTPEKMNMKALAFLLNQMDRESDQYRIVFEVLKNSPFKDALRLQKRVFPYREMMPLLLDKPYTRKIVSELNVLFKLVDPEDRAAVAHLCESQGFQVDGLKITSASPLPESDTQEQNSDLKIQQKIFEDACDIVFSKENPSLESLAQLNQKMKVLLEPDFARIFKRDLVNSGYVLDDQNHISHPIVDQLAFDRANLIAFIGPLDVPVLREFSSLYKVIGSSDLKKLLIEKSFINDIGYDIDQDGDLLRTTNSFPTGESFPQPSPLPSLPPAEEAKPATPVETEQKIDTRREVETHINETIRKLMRALEGRQPNMDAIRNKPADPRFTNAITSGIEELRKYFAQYEVIPGVTQNDVNRLRIRTMTPFTLYSDIGKLMLEKTPEAKTFKISDALFSRLEYLLFL